MKTVTYHGPSDRRRVEDRYLPRGVPVDLPNSLAAKVANHPRVTVEDAEDPEADDGHAQEE